MPDTPIAAKAIRDAAADALEFSHDRRKKILPRIALRVAANWLTVRAERLEAAAAGEPFDSSHYTVDGHHPTSHCHPDYCGEGDDK